jgi:hypothetical protein
MKSLILSFLVMLGLATLIYSVPVNDIYFMKYQVVTGQTYVTEIPSGRQEIGYETAIDTNVILREGIADIKGSSAETAAVAPKSLPGIKMKNVGEANFSDPTLNEEKVFIEKLAVQLTEQRRNEAGSNEISEPLENDFYSFKMKIPRSISLLINAKDKSR